MAKFRISQGPHQTRLAGFNAQMHAIRPRDEPLLKNRTLTEYSEICMNPNHFRSMLAISCIFAQKGTRSLFRLFANTVLYCYHFP